VLCPRCRKPMKIDIQTAYQILWKCKLCDLMTLENTCDPACYDDIGGYNESNK